MKRKVISSLLALGSIFALASCGSEPSTSVAPSSNVASTSSSSNVEVASYEGFGVGSGFASHGDVAYCNIKIDATKKITDIELKEVFGIRSVGNIVNNRTYDENNTETTKAEDIAKCEAVAAENKVVSDVSNGKNYESYKYLYIGGKLLICAKSGGAPVYNEDSTAESALKDVNALLKDNANQETLNWWYTAVKANDCKFLKVAGESDTVVTTASDGTKLASMKDGFDTFYGSSMDKSVNYTSNWRGTKSYAEDIEALNEYIKDNGVDIDANSDDFKSSVTLTSASAYITVAKAAYDNAVSKIAA